MLVEVKTRTEDFALRIKMESVGLGKTESVRTLLDKHNSLSSDVEKANEQLKRFAIVGDFRVLWFRADNGLFVQDAREQIGSTLLGIRMVFGKRCGQKTVLPCVYAGYADFFRFTEIDGALIEVDGALTLLPNEFSPRKEPFYRSPLAQVIAPAIFDVQQGERDGLFYVIDSNMNRKNENEVLEFLRKKYPADEFLKFGVHAAGTVVTTIDARGEGDV